MKKGQITIFIIIGVLILVVLAFFFIYQKPTIKQTIPLTIQPIHSFVQSCIEETTKQALIYISARGGYYETPEKNFDQLIPYYLYETANNMPSKEKIQQQISLYVNENLDFCINDFIDFPEFQIQTSEIKTTTKIKDNIINFNINYPLSILKQEQTYTFDNFETEVKIRLGIVYDSIHQIMQEQIKDPTGLDYHYVYEVSVENDLNIKMVGFIENTIIFMVTDKNSKLNEEDFVFIFANKYS